MVRDLRREVRHLTRKLKKNDDELQKLRKSHSEATREVTRLRNLHRKDFMEYSRKKADFKKDLEELQKRASDRAWTQASKISSLEVELNDAREKIRRLENTSAWSTSKEHYGWDWGKRFSALQHQLGEAEASYVRYRVDWCRQLGENKRQLRMYEEVIARLQGQLAGRGQASSSGESEGMQSLRNSLAEMSAAFERESAELKQLKIQMACERQAVKDAEAESEVLRKRLRESEGESHRFHQMYREMLLRKKDLEVEVENLKLSLLLAESPKSEEAELPTELP